MELHNEQQQSSSHFDDDDLSSEHDASDTKEMGTAPIVEPNLEVKSIRKGIHSYKTYLSMAITNGNNSIRWKNH